MNAEIYRHMVVDTYGKMFSAVNDNKFVLMNDNTRPRRTVQKPIILLVKESSRISGPYILRNYIPTSRVGHSRKKDCA